jgi:hypothetical protein
VDFNWILIFSGIFRISVNPFADAALMFFIGIEWNKYLIDIVKPAIFIFCSLHRSLTERTLFFWYRHNFLVSHHHVITVLRVLYPFVYAYKVYRKIYFIGFG